MTSRLYSVYNLTRLGNIGFELFADLTSFKNLQILLNGPPPDIVGKNSKKHSVIELSRCSETNYVKTRN